MKASDAKFLADSRYADPLRAWWMVAIFCFAGFVSYTHRLILGVVVDPLRADLGIGDSSVSLLQGTAFALIYVIAGLPLGRLADVGKRRNLMFIGSIIWCVGTISCGFSPTFWSLFLSRVLVGIGEAALAPAAASMIGDSFPPHRRGIAIGLFFMGMVVGGPAAIGIGGYVYGLAQAEAFEALPIVGQLTPWRAVLVLTGAGGLAVPLLLLTIREPVRRGRQGEMPIRRVFEHFVTERRLLLTLLLGIALLSVGDYGLLSWVPTTLSRAFGWTPAELGPPFGIVTAIAGILGALSGGALIDACIARGGRRLGLAACMAFAGLASIGALLVAASGPQLVLLGTGIWIFGSAVSATAGIALLQIEIPNELRGIGMSLVAFFNTLLGLGVGPTFVAMVTEYGYADTNAVGLSIATVVFPAALLSVALYFLARNVPQKEIKQNEVSL